MKRILSSDGDLTWNFVVGDLVPAQKWLKCTFATVVKFLSCSCSRASYSLLLFACCSLLLAVCYILAVHFCFLLSTIHIPYWHTRCNWAQVLLQTLMLKSHQLSEDSVVLSEICQNAVNSCNLIYIYLCHSILYRISTIYAPVSIYSCL